MSQAVEAVSWTIYDLEVLPKNDAIHYEVIDGELFMTRSPHRKHQQVCGKIFALLDTWSESTNLGVTIITPGIIFSEVDSVIPDLVWVSKERLSEIEDEAGHLTAAPELVVEVLSPGKQNELRDKETKLKLYSVRGVQEYWIADRFHKQVEVYRREQARLVLVATLMGNDQITSPLLPGFTCSIHRFFPE
ncbi:MAG: Uma2 family endonuclease [Crinalium sp.]